MNALDDPQAALDEVARRQEQTLDAAARGRNRGWDTTGALVGWLGFAAMDLPVPSPARFTLFGVAMVGALVCFTLGGHRGRALAHRTQWTGRSLTILAVFALASAAIAFGGVFVVNELDLPAPNTITGGILMALVMTLGRWHPTLGHRAAR